MHSPKPNVVAVKSNKQTKKNYIRPNNDNYPAGFQIITKPDLLRKMIEKKNTGHVI